MYIPGHESGSVIEGSIPEVSHIPISIGSTQGRCLMGSGGWDHSASTARSQTRSARSVQETVLQDFTQTRESRIHPGMHPNGLVFRESRDSVEHPKSRAIIGSLDITQSMQGLPPLLARETLPQLMAGVLPILPDAQLCFMAFGDADDGHNYQGPWQVGQFESSDELADAWLTRIWLQGSAGSSPCESADLILYTAARLTRIDCHEKRGEKGYLFILTDDTCRDYVCAATVNKWLGRQELDENVSIEAIIQEAAEKYHIFVLIPDQARAVQMRGGERVIDHYRRRIGNGAIALGGYQDTSIVAAMLIGLTEGAYNMSNVDHELRTRYGKSGDELNRLLMILRPYAESLPKTPLIVDLPV
ncbi:MAG: hypothetical protein NTX72_01330 [Candidatus Uhrbacteria bacterium]|nr:hypothetical protein [Candidatus Uhrbacteria bacterium]